jgi:hypothetical protein
MKRKSLAHRKIIGWREWVGLPELGIEAIKVKVDSGAKTCALHATKIRYLDKHDGETWVSFMVVSQTEPRHAMRVRAPLVEQRVVRSSMGHASLRPVIRTQISLGGETWPVQITLVNRDPMGFRMLIGRQALKGRFLIHPAKSFIRSKPREES